MTTPLGRVRGLGSAKGGTRSYVLKQASGLALGMLTPYLIGIGVYLFGRDRDFALLQSAASGSGLPFSRSFFSVPFTWILGCGRSSKTTFMAK